MRDGFWIELAMFFASDCSESSSDLKYAWIECLKKDRVLFSSRLSWIFVGIGSWGGFGFMVFLILISLGSLWAGSFPGEIFCCSWEPCRAAKHWPSLAIRSGSYTSSYSCVVSSGCASLNERCSFHWVQIPVLGLQFLFEVLKGHAFVYGGVDQVAIITPFNFPLEIPVLQVLGALFMGNKPLLKVDSKVVAFPSL